MNIKKCEKCGSEFPGDIRNRHCPKCKTEFKMGKCRSCGEWADKLTDGRCRPCKNRFIRNNRAKKKAMAISDFNTWQDEIKKIPTPYKTLTEQEWTKACNYFKGCAYCGSASIDARHMFIAHKFGGRYCAWNIVPACEACAQVTAIKENPFERMNEKINSSKASQVQAYSWSKEKLQKILGYLGPILKEAQDE